MKYLSFIGSFIIFVILGSCSSNGDLDYPVFMQPSSITTSHADGYNQTFEYDEYGRIVNWNLITNSSDDRTVYKAQYYYPDENTIKVLSEESWLHQKRCFVETIQLVNGRASRSEGTFIFLENDHIQSRKTYRLEFTYIPSNHLNIVKHLEVIGIGDEIKDNAWDKAWTWENYLIWEDGNLKEFQDFQGHSYLYSTTKYEYTNHEVDYPVIIPIVINNAHHIPLFMQGVFGLNSANLVKSSFDFDDKGNLYLSRQYSYELEKGRVKEFIETIVGNSDFSKSIPYNVYWTEK